MARATKSQLSAKRLGKDQQPLLAATDVERVLDLVRNALLLLALAGISCTASVCVGVVAGQFCGKIVRSCARKLQCIGKGSKNDIARGMV